MWPLTFSPTGTLIRPAVLHRCAADQAVGTLQGDRAHQVVAQVLCRLEGDGARLAAEGQLGGQGVVDPRDGVGGELDVHDRADHPGDSAGGTRLHGPAGLFCSSGSHLSHFT